LAVLSSFGAEFFECGGVGLPTELEISSQKIRVKDMLQIIESFNTLSSQKTMEPAAELGQSLKHFFSEILMERTISRPSFV
jgi:hypothetical protein